MPNHPSHKMLVLLHQCHFCLDDHYNSYKESVCLRQFVMCIDKQDKDHNFFVLNSIKCKLFFIIKTVFLNVHEYICFILKVEIKKELNFLKN